MARPSYPILPTGQARDPRRVAQVTNGVLGGKTNNVEDFTIPDTTATKYTVSDPRVSDWSFIGLMPQDANAQVGCWVVPGDKTFDVFLPATQSGDATFRYVVVA